MKIMNKIMIGTDKLPHLFVDKDSKYEIIVNENVENKLVIIGTSDCEINVILKENSKLIVNSLNKDNNVNVNISLNKGCEIIYNHSVLARKNSINNFNINHNDSDSTSILNNNGINLGNNKLFFNIDGVIPKNKVNINCSQSSKILNLKNGDAKIIPNLIIDSNDIIANHAAYIGKIDDDVMFYLESRGISRDNIKKLIYKSCMIGKMHIDEEEINQILNEWW